MSTSLIPQDLHGESKYGGEKALTQVSKTGDWLPYIQLMGSSSEKVKAGQFPMGHFALSENQTNLDLGAEFDCVVIAWRPKAMCFNDMTTHFDPDSDMFKAYEEKAKEKNSGYGAGAEFLLWIPQVMRLATYFMANKGGKREAPNVRSFIGQGMTLKAEFVPSTKRNPHSFHAPKAFACNLDLQLPDWDEVKPQIDKFKNPPASDTELASEGGRER